MTSLPLIQRLYAMSLKYMEIPEDTTMFLKTKASHQSRRMVATTNATFQAMLNETGSPYQE